MDPLVHTSDLQFPNFLFDILSIILENNKNIAPTVKPVDAVKDS